MKRKLGKGILICLAVSTLLTGCTGTNKAAQESTSTKESVESASGQTHKIGVAVYDLTDDEVRMFQHYYADYLGEAFDVEFLYSPAIGNVEEEKEFVDNAKKEGCEGIISFVTYDLPQIVDYCGDRLYYVMGSGSVSEEDFDAVKDEEHFLGIIGPSSENEKLAGKNIMNHLAGSQGSQKTYLLLSGGAGIGNYMHKERVEQMLRTLENEQEFSLTRSPEELSQATETILAGSSKEGGEIYLCPGYYYSETSRENLTDALKKINPDVIASVCAVNMLSDTIKEKEAAQGKDILVGTIDCFSENNKKSFETTDAFGKSSLNYIEGKCGVMAAPAFVAMYNAITGHADTVRDNGEAFRLYQDFWRAGSAEEYDALFVEAQNIYKNYYSCEDLMNAITVYTPEANYEDFAFLTEGVEDTIFQKR